MNNQEEQIKIEDKQIKIVDKQIKIEDKQIKIEEDIDTEQNIDTKKVRKTPKGERVRIAVIGNVDAGKSTLVGTLTKGVCDDGNGFARNLVMNYKHELEVGRTSSIAYQIIGFDKNGN